MRILSIDYGIVKTGVAFYDGSLIQPLEVIPSEDFSKLTQKINSSIQALGVKQIILGLPESGVVVEQVKKVGETLKEISGLEVIYHPETLTTIEANVRMRETGWKKKKRIDNEDAVAAALLLEDYLEINNLR